MKRGSSQGSCKGSSPWSSGGSSRGFLRGSSFCWIVLVYPDSMKESLSQSRSPFVSQRLTVKYSSRKKTELMSQVHAQRLWADFLMKALACCMLPCSVRLTLPPTTFTDVINQFWRLCHSTSKKQLQQYLSLQRLYSVIYLIHWNGYILEDILHTTRYHVSKFAHQHNHRKSNFKIELRVRERTWNALISDDTICSRIFVLFSSLTKYQLKERPVLCFLFQIENRWLMVQVRYQFLPSVRYQCPPALA